MMACLSYACNKETEQAEPNIFCGLWSLYIVEQINSETGEWGGWRKEMQGNILNDDKNNMAVHLTTKGYEETDLRFPNFEDSISIEALKYLTNLFVYFAKYSVDEEQKVVEHV
jgi:hypothetical protein